MLTVVNAANPHVCSDVHPKAYTQACRQRQEQEAKLGLRHHERIR